MASLDEPQLKQLKKEQLIAYALELQQKLTDFNALNETITTALSEFNERFSKLESELAISRTVNNSLVDRVKQLEVRCWENEQYSRRECLEISGIPSEVTNDKLEEKSLEILKLINDEINKAAGCNDYNLSDDILVRVKRGLTLSRSTAKQHSSLLQGESAKQLMAYI